MSINKDLLLSCGGDAIVNVNSPHAYVREASANSLGLVHPGFRPDLLYLFDLRCWRRILRSVFISSGYCLSGSAEYEYPGAENPMGSLCLTSDRF